MAINIQTAWTALSPAVWPILADVTAFNVLQGLKYEETYNNITLATGAKFVREGLVVALADSGTDSRYVPYMSDASYGTNSDVPVGILHERISVSGDEPWGSELFTRMVSPLYRAEVIDANVYTEEDGLGAVPQAIKDALPLIHFKEG